MGAFSAALGEIGIWFLTIVVMLGAVPMMVVIYQNLLIMFHHRSDHYDRSDPEYLPRVAVLVPAWNEAPVLRYSIDSMMALEYPPNRLRVAVVDDASSDETAELMAAKQQQYPGRVLHLRRDKGGQGKAHTLNHGLRELLSNDWAQAILVTDADVVFLPTSIRRMTRHLADPRVGAVTGYIREASEPATSLNRYIGYEYATAQAVARRANNVMGAQACLAGGAQLHSRENLEAIGGQIDSTTLAEDTVTTFLTQLNGRRVIFDGNAQSLAEEPAEIAALWKQRLRWARGNLQVTRRFAHVFFHRSREHGLGGFAFGLAWYCILTLPVLSILASAALIVLWTVQFQQAQDAFRMLWILNAAGYVLTTTYTLLIDTRMARRSWLQAITFPGLLNLLVVAWVLVPAPTHALVRVGSQDAGLGWSQPTQEYLALCVYLWVALCIPAAWLVYRLDKSGLARTARLALVVVGYGPLLCAVTLAAYVAEARGDATTWDKTEKTGRVSVS
jgi:cellulose synthase/poly-beta-1,6-N-acetylglucosamine synthase-like glycosyltransferase